MIMDEEEDSCVLVLYTGSASVGKIVAEAAAKTLTPTTLEVSFSPTSFPLL